MKIRYGFTLFMEKTIAKINLPKYEKLPYKVATSF